MLRVSLIAFVLLHTPLLSPAQAPTDRAPGELRLHLKKSRHREYAISLIQKRYQSQNAALIHAFPDNRNGVITITLHSTNDHHLLRTITDNTVGLPPEIDMRQTNPPGMSLMQDLGNFVDKRITGPDAVRVTTDLLTETVTYE
jgi:hypothetical protein